MTEVLKPHASYIAVHGHLPKTKELYETFATVMGNFAYMNTQPAGVPGMALRPLPVEMKVELKGEHQSGCLVFRTSERLGPFLLECATGETEDNGSPDDAIQEIVNLYTGHVLTECFEPRGIVFGFFLPKVSTPADWPMKPPDAACAVLVEDIPVEIRIWVDSL